MKIKFSPLVVADVVTEMVKVIKLKQKNLKLSLHVGSIAALVAAIKVSNLFARSVKFGNSFLIVARDCIRTDNAYSFNVCVTAPVKKYDKKI